MRRLLGAAATLACATAAGQPDLDVTWLSFVQLTAEHANGASGVDFGTDRVRAKVEVSSARLTGGAMLDFGVSNLGDAPPGTLANVVADLYVDYRLGENHLLRFGQFKTPLGMDFNMSGHLLDLTKRGMEAGLVFNRDLGVMLNGQRGTSGFGYDIGVFNPPGRSGATSYLASQRGDDNAVVGRLRYDAAAWHAEVAYGESSAAGGPGTATYESTDAGFRYNGSNWNAKIEWIEGRGVRGDAGREETVYYLHGGYTVTPVMELVARHYSGRSDLAGTTTRLANTFLGVSARLFASARSNGRLQVNYVFAGADTGQYSGVSGYRDDSLLVQFQVYVEK
jgi:hypothetical protein